MPTTTTKTNYRLVRCSQTHIKNVPDDVVNTKSTRSDEHVDDDNEDLAQILHELAEAAQENAIDRIKRHTGNGRDVKWVVR